jgi:serine phosphatase RsbU (regulator of sigma subunit)
LSAPAARAIQSPAAGRRRFGLAARIAALAVASVLATSIVLAWIGYREETRAATRGIDQKLGAVARTLTHLLPADMQREASSGSMTPEKYERVVRNLSRIASEAGVFYLYTCIERDGKIYIPVSSASKEELDNRDWPPAMDEYDQPPPEVQQTLKDGVSRYASYTDEFGSFRSIFVPFELDGQRVVVGVDVQLDDLHAIARANLIRFALIGLTSALVLGALAGYVGHHMTAPIATVREDVKSFADDDFSNDDASVASLIEIAGKDRTEIGQLASAFLDMRQRLIRHVENLTKVTAEKQEIVSRMETARRIQRSLLPDSVPVTAAFDIYGWSEAAEETGGDFYDWIDLPDGRIVISVADVTGHGIGPAMMAAVCRAYARATMQGEGALGPMMDKLNRLVLNDTKGEQFVTYFVSVIDPRTRKVRIISAGHGPILLYHSASGEIQETRTHGPPLGLFDDLAADPITEITLEPGDVMMVVSDGFFEWMNTHGEQFGTDRLRDSLKRNASVPAEEIVNRLRSEVQEFTVGIAQPDDMTAVIVRCVA